MEILVEQVLQGERTNDGYLPLLLETNLGNIEAHYYEAERATAAILCVGGVGGGFDTPAKVLYPSLCRELAPKGISGLRIKYRDPSDLEASVLDVLIGVAFLQSEGVRGVGLIGHSFGGAVVVQAAALSDSIETVVTLATQSFGVEAAGELKSKSALFVHGIEDQLLPPSCSVYAHKLAPEPKQLVLIEGVGHGLHEKADEVYNLVKDWIMQAMNKPALTTGK